MPDTLYLASATIGFVSVVVATVELVRGTDFAPQDVKRKLRVLWIGVPTNAYMRLAYHDAPEPVRSRLRRSGWAQVTFLVTCVWVAMNLAGMAGGAIAAPFWFLAFAGAIGAANLVRGLLRRPQAR